MLFSQLACALALASSVYAIPANQGGKGAAAAGGQQLNVGSENDGTDEIGAEDGEAASLTSNNDFSDFCNGQTLTNGEQNTAGSCNLIPMGQIPSKKNMISLIFLSPTDGETIQGNSNITFSVQTANLEAGSFTNADSTYYAAPQSLKNGNVVGHTHVTVQAIDKNSKTAPDATVFAFFKGINDAGNGQGLLSAVAVGGLPTGDYRACTMTSASNHQPVLMPVAQRGAQDDCIRFTVANGSPQENTAANDASGGLAAAAEAQSAVDAGVNDILSSTSSAAASSSSSAAAKGGKGAATAAAGAAQATGAGNAKAAGKAGAAQATGAANAKAGAAGAAGAKGAAAGAQGGAADKGAAADVKGAAAGGAAQGKAGGKVRRTRRSRTFIE